MEIERENKILLEKMSNIMQKPKQLYDPSKSPLTSNFLCFSCLSKKVIKPLIPTERIDQNNTRKLINIT